MVYSSIKANQLITICGPHAFLVRFPKTKNGKIPRNLQRSDPRKNGHNKNLSIDHSSVSQLTWSGVRWDSVPTSIFDGMLNWVFPKKGGKPPKWIVYFMENPMKKWMTWGVFPLFLEIPNCRSLENQKLVKKSFTSRYEFGEWP